MPFWLVTWVLVWRYGVARVLLLWFVSIVVGVGIVIWLNRPQVEGTRIVCTADSCREELYWHAAGESNSILHCDEDAGIMHCH
jgi:hypothetical protein